MTVMRHARRTRLVLFSAAILLGPALLAAAQTSTLPATPPTSALLPAGTAGPPPANAASRRADVSYTDGLLSIAASNASLNQILREVGRVTGMKITGAVAEDRVFGSYGPAPASQVLASLLDGTSTNILIVDNAGDAPAELILTPRQGGPTPPNPNAAALSDTGAELPQQPLPSPAPFRNGPQIPPTVNSPHPDIGGLPASNGGQTNAPTGGGADLGTTPGAFIPAGQSPPDLTAQPPAQPGTSSGSSDPSQPQSPNGVSTPQQIYEQLMRLRQQLQQQQQTNPQ